MSFTVNGREAVRQRYFLKLHNVYYQVAPMFLRKVFCEMWKTTQGSEWEKDKSNGKKLSALKGLQPIFRNGKLQKKYVESGNCHLWDISLLIDIIIAIKSEHPKTILPSFDLSAFTKKNLEWLKNTRNQIAHASSTEMDQQTFQPLWNESVKVLTSLGMPEQDMELIATSPGVTLQPAKQTANEIQAEQLKHFGNECYRNGNIPQALIDYSQAIELEDISQELLGALYYNRSTVHTEIGNFSAAKDDAKSAITLRPNWYKGYTRLGIVYEKSKQFVKALFNYLLAVDLGDHSKKTLDSIEYCKMMIHKLRRSEATDPELLRQKDLRNKASNMMVSTFLGKEQSERFMEGTPHHLCTIAHRYYFGRDGYPQSYEKAVEYFAQAAQLGNAEGLYNLGCMTQEGKGVEKNVFKGHQYILEAANKPTVIEYIPGSGIKFHNIGAIESWHRLGMAYEEGIVVEEDKNKALEWYKKAMEFGSGLSANNTACIYEDAGPDQFSKAIEFWKLSAYLKIQRAAENLVNMFRKIGNLKSAQEWYHYAISMGSIDVILYRDAVVHDPEIKKSFNPEEFWLKLHEDVETSSILSPILLEINKNRNPNKDDPFYEQMRQEFEAFNEGRKEIGDRNEAIRAHRESQEHARKSSRNRCQDFSTTAAPNFMVTSSGVDLIQMQEIFFKELNEAKEDKVFTGRVLKLKVIEDAILGNPSIYLLVEDNHGDIGRLFVYNYPQRMQTHEEIGYGCQFYLIYPHYRSMRDGMKGLRVDDPQLIFKQPHLRNKDLCRYCGNSEGSKVQCRKCRRVTYCSKLCLKKDVQEREHSLVCVKTLTVPGNSISHK